MTYNPLKSLYHEILSLHKLCAVRGNMFPTLYFTVSYIATYKWVIWTKKKKKYQNLFKHNPRFQPGAFYKVLPNNSIMSV